MPTKLIGQLSAPSGTIGTGNWITIDVPIGRRYHVLWLTMNTATNSYSSGQTPSLADFATEIRVSINGRVQRQCSLAEMNLLQGLMGLRHYTARGEATGTQGTTTPGMIYYFGLDGLLKRASDNAAFSYTAAGGCICYFPIFLAEPWRKNYQAQEAFAWPTRWANGAKPINSITIELRCGSRLAGVVAKAEYDFVDGPVDEQGNPIVLVSSIEKATAAHSGTSEITYQQLPRAASYQTIVLQLDNTAHTVNNVTLKVNDLIVREQTRQELWSVVNSREGAFMDFAISNTAPIVFDHDDLPDSALSTVGVNILELKTGITAAAGGTLNILYERFGPML